MRVSVPLLSVRAWSLTALVLTIVLGVFTGSAHAQGTSLDPGGPGLSIGSWDVNLTPLLSGQDDVVDRVAGSGFDVLALQGVWSSAAQDALLADPRIAQQYPYHYSAPAAQVAFPGARSVSRTDVENYVYCLLGRGQDFRTIITPSPPADPICSFLGLNIRFLNEQVYSALVATLQTEPFTGDGGVDAIDRVFAATGLTYGYDGRPGQLILSDRPIEDPQNTTFDTDLVRRNNIVATIAGLKIVFGNWPANYLEDADPGLGQLQVGALQTDLATDALNDSPDLIVGSLQTGPDYQPEAYQQLLAAGFRPSSHAETYCPNGSAGFSRCAVDSTQVQDMPPRATDNILAGPGIRCVNPATFGTDPQLSEHIGVAARCGHRPVVTGLASAHGPMTGGQSVVITGSGFTDATQVFFGPGTPATSFSVDSDTQITAVSPAHVRGTVPVRVKATGLSAKSRLSRYRYTGA